MKSEYRLTISFQENPETDAASDQPEDQGGYRLPSPIATEHKPGDGQWREEILIADHDQEFDSTALDWKINEDRLDRFDGQLVLITLESVEEGVKWRKGTFHEAAYLENWLGIFVNLRLKSSQGFAGQMQPPRGRGVHSRLRFGGKGWRAG
jgi:hypothetical protein